MHRIALLAHQRHQCVAHFVVGDDLALARIEQAVFLLEAGHDPLDGSREILHGDGFGASSRRHQRGFVDQIGEVGARESRREGGYGFQIQL